MNSMCTIPNDFPSSRYSDNLNFQKVLLTALSSAAVVFICVVDIELLCLMGVTKYYKRNDFYGLFDLIIFAWFLSNPPDTGESKNDV